MKSICIIGLGYIGLPTASMFATHGWQVTGVDTDPQVVTTLNQGGIRIEENGLLEVVRQAFDSGNLTVQQTPVPADVFIIAVPTPFLSDKRADMSMVAAATEALAPHLRPGNLVVLESTSPPGTTTGLVQPILERNGLKAGQDFLLAYSPERVLPGQILRELVENARVIGGVSPASAEAGRDLYAAFVKGEIVLTDAVTAEMVKLMENTFRDVNIALANEFALIAERIGVNVWEAIEIANRHPRVNILRPGPGVGGHCIAVDPWFLVEAAPEQACLIRQARQINDSMPENVAALAQEVVANLPAPVIACLGLTFKPDVDDTRESPAVEVMERLVTLGYTVRAFDPHVPAEKFAPYQTDTFEEAVSGADLAILLVDHKAFSTLTPDDFALMNHRKMIDTRNLFKSESWQGKGIERFVLGKAKH